METTVTAAAAGLGESAVLGGCEPETIREHLARILRSPPFARAARMQRFLSFLVTETLAGRSAQLKEYTIAVSVFGKSADFEPGTSALVRVDAGRLRKLLLQYRYEHGAGDSMLIEVPKGSYVPVFRPAKEQTALEEGGPGAMGRSPVGHEQNTKTQPAWSSSQERRQITVLSCAFGDEGGAGGYANVDSGLLSAFDTFHEKCTGIARQHGGSVDGTSSDRLIVYFGWPNALEDAAGRALTATLEMLGSMQEAFPNPSLGVRIGVATSEVVTRSASPDETSPRPTVIGEAPSLATKMLPRVPLNGILVAESTRRLTGSSFEFVPASALEGQVGESSLLWRLLRAKPVVTRFRAVHVGQQWTIVGRREEIALLMSRWRLSLEGEGQAVVLVGEAGIGKSKLAESLLERIVEQGTQLRVQCSPHHTNSTLYPFIELINSSVRAADHPGAELELERFLERFGLGEPLDRALLRALVSQSGEEGLEALSASQKKDLTLKLLLRWLSFQIGAQPTVLLVEDIHWADPTTLELLQDILRLSARMPLLVLITSRGELGSSWVQQTNVTSIRLTRLPKNDCNELIDRLLSATSLSSSARSLILDKAEGIPLFLEELTKLLLAGDASRSRDSLIPQSLGDLLISQLDKLGATRRVAQMAAVIGRQFTRELLAHACGYAGEDIDIALDQLIAAGILVRVSPESTNAFSFRHALLRDAAYESVLDHSRRELHYRVGTVLVDLFPEVAIEHPELIARHMTDAMRHDEAIPFWVDAGRKAAGRYALAEAIADFRHALDALAALPVIRANQERELEVLIELGLATRNARGYADLELANIYQQARALAADLGKTEQLANAIYGLWTHAAGRGQWKMAVTLATEFENFTRQMEDSQLEVEAFRLLGASSALMGEFAIARRHFERALSIYDPSRHGPRFGFDPGAVSAAYLAWTVWHLGGPEQAKVYAQRALSIAEAKNHAPTVALVLSWLMFFEICARNPAAVLEYNGRLQAVCAERDCRYWQPFGTACAEWAAFQGDTEPRHLERMLEAIRLFSELYLTSALLVLAAELCSDLGRPEQGLEIITLAARFIEEHDERVWEAECYRRRAELLLQISPGDPQPARQLLVRAVRVARHQEACVLEQRSGTRLAELDADPGHLNISAAEPPETLH
jgi:hypothetical protein